MQENQEDSYSLTDLVRSTKSFFRYLRRRWWVALVAAAAGAGLGFLYYGSQKPKYEAVSTFILEDKSTGGGLSGLASQFGFNLGSLTGNSNIFSGDNILNILKSKKVVTHVLLSPMGDSASGGQTLADAYLDFSGLRHAWRNTEWLRGINLNPVNKTLTPLQDSVLNVVYERMVETHLTTQRPSKQGTIINVQVTAPNALFARLTTQRLVTEASELYLAIRTGTAQDNIRELQRRSDSLLFLLNRKSYTAAAAQPLDINPGIRTAAVPVEIANRDKTVIATIYTEVTKNLEASKLLLSQQTPVIQLLDQPGYLLKDKKKPLFLVVAVGVTAALFLWIVVAFIRFQISTQPDVHNRSFKNASTGVG